MRRRKSNTCLNCGATLDSVYNYCPICGQENNSNNVSFGKLLKEFFVNYFSLDSRLTQSLKPFFFKPGLLTLKFNEGKRMSYMNPVRLYLILSLFYFFVFTQAGQTMTKEGNSTIRSHNLVSIENIPDSIQQEIKQSLDSAAIQRLNSQMDDHSLYNFYSNLTSEEKEKIYPILLNAGFDSTVILNPEKIRIAGNDKTSFTVTKTDNKSFILNRVDFSKLNRLAKEGLPDKEIYDSLRLGEVTFMEGLVVKQIIRITKADKKVLVGYILKNVPVMMLMLLPLFALILKLLYIRRDVLYISHLIHAIHLHCFAYFVYGISMIFTVWLLDGTVSTLVSFLAFVLVTIYAFKSFRKVYQQHWFKTFLKFAVTGTLYGVLVLIFFMAETTLSILLF